MYLIMAQKMRADTRRVTYNGSRYNLPVTARLRQRSRKANTIKRFVMLLYSRRSTFLNENGSFG
jgi:hypothetical protein